MSTFESSDSDLLIFQILACVYPIAQESIANVYGMLYSI